MSRYFGGSMSPPDCSGTDAGCGGRMGPSEDGTRGTFKRSTRRQVMKKLMMALVLADQKLLHRAQCGERPETD